MFANCNASFYHKFPASLRRQRWMTFPAETAGTQLKDYPIIPTQRHIA